MSYFFAAPPPPMPLGRYRVLVPLAGVRVSPLQLGTMSIRDQREKIGFSPLNKESSFKLVDAFYEAGGNFIDTASNYQGESSEKFLEEWMEQRGIRDQIVIVTKYTSNYKLGRDDIPVKVNYTGNNAKTLFISVEETLKKLRTTYIDILYVHWWDWQTSIKEVMDRSFERDIIPMASSLGLALAPWNVLAKGKLRTDAEEERRLASGEKGREYPEESWLRNEDEKKISAALEKVAKEVGTEHTTAVAIPYVLQKAPNVFPITSGRNVEYLAVNIEGLEISLSDKQIKYLESIIRFDHGFPNSLIGDGTPQRLPFMYDGAAQWDRWPQRQVCTAGVEHLSYCGKYA